jgi:hypothetical protein
MKGILAIVFVAGSIALFVGYRVSALPKHSRCLLVQGRSAIGMTMRLASAGR